MQTSLAVANWFVSASVSNNSYLTQMKLQKLIFFAHGWNLALYDSPLVSENFQAWKFGPVIPSVYHKFRHYGMSNINQFGSEFTATPEGYRYIAPQIIDTSQTVESLLTRIWEVFGIYSGDQLSEMTHEPNTPWSLARSQYPDNTPSIPISNDSIMHYFKGLQG